MIEPAEIRDDDVILDLVFERAVEQIEAGQAVEVEVLLAGREHLKEEAEALVRCARHLRRTTAADQAPAEVAGYDLVREIGRGAMGTVFLARSRNLGGRPIALKLLPRAARFSDRARDRFRLEAQALSRIRHPNVVTILDVVREPDLDAYAMEWVEGLSLADLIRRLARDGEPPDLVRTGRHLDPDRARPWDGNFVTFACRLGIMLARALAEVHRAGVLHRDVKPSNVLVRRDGTPVLSDFGLARNADLPMQTETGRFLGTAAYAPPEQLRGEHSQLGPASDVYSLGVTLYHLLALELPFAAGSTSGIVEAAERGDFTPLRRRNRACPADLGTVIEKALAPGIPDRYPSADAFADDLERVLRLEPVHARPASTLTCALRFTRRHRRALLGALTGAVAVLGVVIPLVLRSQAQGRLRERVASLRQEAQLLLLEPWMHNEVQWSLGGRPQGAPSLESFAARRPESRSKALQIYDEAVALAPGDLDLRLERTILARAQAVMGGWDATSELDALVQPRPMIEKLIFGWPPGASPPPISDAELAACGVAERRAAGLFAALRFDPVFALKLWGNRPIDAMPDVLIDGLQGEMCLARGRPDHAWPLFLRAFEAAPRSRYLGSLVADCGIRLGALGAVESLVDRLPELEGPDPFETATRVRADFLCARGRHQEARSIYESLLRRHAGHDLLLGYSKALLGVGESARAIGVLVRRAEAAPEFVRFAADALHEAESWWAGLRSGERWRILRSAVEEPAKVAVATPAALGFGAILKLKSMLLASSRAVPLETVGENSFAPATVEAISSSQGLKDSPLLRLVRDEEVFTMLQTRFHSAPAPLKDAAATLALLPGLRKAFPVLPALLVALLSATSRSDSQSILWTFDGSTPNGFLGWEIDAAGDVDGDGFKDILSGEPGASVPGVGIAGQARVWSGRTGIPLLTVSGLAAGDNLGLDVSGIGDLDGDGVRDLLIGAYQFGNGGPGYVQVVSAATGALLFTQTGLGAGDAFGTSLDSLGDITGDGIDDYIVGAVGPNLNSAGYARIFSGATHALICHLPGAAWDKFGTDVAGIGGDVDLDLVPDFIVGAYQGWAPAGPVGFARVFSGATCLPIRTHSGGVPSRFGVRVAAIGDVSVPPDGVPDYCVGGDYYLNWTGRAIAYSGLTGAPLWTATGTTVLDHIGYGLAGTGADWNGNGVLDVAIGAGQTGTTPGTGYVRIVEGSTGVTITTLFGDSAGDRAGVGLASVGDVDGDTIADLGCGMVLDDNQCRNNSGSVRVYSPVTRCLSADIHTIFSACGGTQTFTLSGGSAGQFYWLVGSLTGTTPGFPVGTVVVPLVFDLYTQFTISNPNTPPLTGTLGFFPASGTATAALTLPPILPPLPFPITAYHAYVTGNVGVGAPTTTSKASNAVQVTWR